MTWILLGWICILCLVCTHLWEEVRNLRKRLSEIVKFADSTFQYSKSVEDRMDLLEKHFNHRYNQLEERGLDY